MIKNNFITASYNFCFFIEILRLSCPHETPGHILVWWGVKAQVWLTVVLQLGAGDGVSSHCSGTAHIVKGRDEYWDTSSSYFHLSPCQLVRLSNCSHANSTLLVNYLITWKVSQLFRCRTQFSLIEHKMRSNSGNLLLIEWTLLLQFLTAPRCM